MRNFLGSEKYWIVPGLIGSAINGSITPLFGFCLGKVVGIISTFDMFKNGNYTGTATKEDILWETDKYVIGFYALSIAGFIFNFFQAIIYNYVG